LELRAKTAEVEKLRQSLEAETKTSGSLKSNLKAKEEELTAATGKVAGLNAQLEAMKRVHTLIFIIFRVHLNCPFLCRTLAIQAMLRALNCQH